MGDLVVMKRLIFEAQTSMVALSRAQADPVADPSLPKTLKYPAPPKCITRLQEIQSAKPPKELRLDSSGQGILAQSQQNGGISGKCGRP